MMRSANALRSAGDFAPIRAQRVWTAPLAIAVLVGIGVLAWWGMTASLIVAERTEVTRRLAAGITTALAAYGLWLAYSLRHTHTSRAAVLSFAGGVLLWLWISALLYGGWVVGIGPASEAPGVSDASVLDAVRAMLYSDVLALATLALVLRLTSGARNRYAACALGTFWAAQQSAKVNIFAGVENPGAEFLPSYLTHLERYFGPSHNTLLLPLAVCILMGGAVWLARRSLVPYARWRREARLLLATTLTLAALEHLFLGMSGGTPLWDVFVSWRGH